MMLPPLFIKAGTHLGTALGATGFGVLIAQTVHDTDPHTSLGVGTALVGLAIPIVAYFLKQKDEQQQKAIEWIGSKLDALTSRFNDHGQRLIEVKTKLEALERIYSEGREAREQQAKDLVRLDQRTKTLEDKL